MERFKLGDKYCENLRFTQHQVEAFAEVTGDKNPLHLDAEYAANTIFKKPIVHGFLAAAVFSKVFGTLFPGEGTIYMYQDMSFMSAVFVEENYVAKFEITEHDETKHRAVVQCLLEDSEGKTMISGKAKIMNLNRL